MKVRSFVVACLLAIASGAAHGHSFHASLAELVWDGDSKALQLSVRLVPDDLEEAVSRHARRKVRLEDAGADALLAAYVAEKMAISADGVPLKWKWVGQDADVHSVWLHLEASLDSPPRRLVITNSLLHEVLDEQVNSVTVKLGSSRSTLTFAAGSGAQSVDLSE